MERLEKNEEKVHSLEADTYANRVNTDDLVPSLLRMYEQGANTDMKIEVAWNGTKITRCFKVHRTIMAMRSPRFAQEFKKNRFFLSITLVVNGISSRTMEILIWYIYSDCLIAENVDEIILFAKAAKYYQIGGADSACLKALSLFVPNELNVCSLLNAAIFFKTDVLFKKCITIIKKNYQNIINSSEFLTANESVVSEVLKHSNRHVSRDVLMNVVFRWLQNNRHANRSLLSNFDLASLSSDDFLDLMEKYPSFLRAKEACNILFNMLRPGILELPSWYRESKSSSPSDIPIDSILENSSRIEILFCGSVSNSSLYGENNFICSVTIMLKQFNNSLHHLTLDMIELPFGSSFVPNDVMTLEVFEHLRKKKLKFSLLETSENYYIVLKEKIKLKKRDPIIFTFTVEVKGLRRWRDSGPLSNHKFRVSQIPENIPFNTQLLVNDIPTMSLSTLSDWIAFIDPISSEKFFLVSALYLSEI